SFSGSFTAPADRLTGRMSLVVEGKPQGSTYINVEEYKRPKFRVRFDPPAEAPRLETEVVVPRLYRRCYRRGQGRLAGRAAGSLPHLVLVGPEVSGFRPGTGDCPRHRSHRSRWLFLD
ncbi:MAG TPA: hypothetical protein VMW24_20030, partial [Sedimentisphaerales bacterium]|nr:hypothetical protein [Sedimentisphaerales bacterium]